MRINGNAAPAEGDIVSPHLTGATIDIAKKGHEPQRDCLDAAPPAGARDAGKIDVEEEFEQACFHITVYKNTLPARRPRPEPSQAGRHDGQGRRYRRM